MEKHKMAVQVVLVVKNTLVKAGDARDTGSMLGSGKSPGGGHRKPLQYSCLENPMDRGVWQDTVHGVAKSRARLSDFTSYVYIRWIQSFDNIIKNSIA